MARLARVVYCDTPFHVTQRGNARQVVSESDADRLVYLALLRSHCRTQRLSLVGYCLMSNHIHMIVVPRRTEALRLALKHTHGLYVACFSARHASSGHLWQGRYVFCALDEPHLWAALRYAELSPVRARITGAPQDYAWSSARAHCGQEEAPPWLETDDFRAAWSVQRWREYLSEEATEKEADAVRACTHTGRLPGSPSFVAELAKTLRRRLAPRKGGRPPKQEQDQTQKLLFACASAAE